jgi:hypothetical protein
VALVQQECTIEVERKLQAKVMVVELAVEIATRLEEIARLNTETSKLYDSMNGKTSLALAVPLKFPGRLFDIVDVCLDNAR